MKCFPTGIALLLLPALTASSASAASAPSPLGSEFRINLFTPYRQSDPDIATGWQGQFVVVWSSEGQDGDGFGVFGRLFDSLGAPLDSDFQINSYTTGLQYMPRVAMDGAGRFVVVWRSLGQDGDGRGVFAQRFDGTGLTLGTEFRVAEATAGNQNRPDVAADDAGNFVVTWEDYPAFSSPAEIRAKLYDSLGSPIGAEILVSSEPGGLEHSPAVTMNASGRFVVTWGRPTGFGLYNVLYGRQFQSAEVAVGSEFAISTLSGPGYYAYYGDYAARASTAGEAGFVVVWERRVDLDVPLQVLGRPYDPNGIAPAEEIPLSDMGVYISYPDVAMAGDGSFVVSWIEPSGVIAERFDSGGLPSGGEFQVNQSTAWSNRSTALAMDPSGGFLVAWSSRLTSTESDILARRYLGTCPGGVSGLGVVLENGGDDLRLTWSDTLNAQDYVVLEDPLPNGGFLTRSGVAAQGDPGLVVPTPAGTTFYLVAGRNGACGLGPLH